MSSCWETGNAVDSCSMKSCHVGYTVSAGASATGVLAMIIVVLVRAHAAAHD